MSMFRFSVTSMRPTPPRALVGRCFQSPHQSFGSVHGQTVTALAKRRRHVGVAASSRAHCWFGDRLAAILVHKYAASYRRLLSDRILRIVFFNLCSKSVMPLGVYS